MYYSGMPEKPKAWAASSIAGHGLGDSPRGSLQSLEFGSRFYESNSAEQWPKGGWVYMGKKCQGNVLSNEYPMRKKQPCPGMCGDSVLVHVGD